MDESANNAEKKSLAEDFDETVIDENLDDSKAKFLNGKQNLDEPHVVVDVGSTSEESFTGLGKEDLEKYANDPFWVRVRMILFVLFWVGWLAMLAAAIVIIVLAPKCPERPDLKWYQTDVVYQINPKSFQDTSDPGSNGAGVGDLSGIKSKVDYLESLSANVLWINSIYKAGDDSFDHNDVVDHKAVDPVFGSMDSFKSLKKITRNKGMKLMLDFIPNHTGKKHEWFTKSEQKEDMYSDFYIWADGKDATSPPNNWMTVYGTPAWTKSDARGQWYYHSYLPEYPDLNLHNEKVLLQLDSVLRFWLDKGVDGFAVQGIQRLVEMVNVTENEGATGQYTDDQPENLELVKRWRNIINSYSNKPGRERALFAAVKPKGDDLNVTSDYHKAGIHVVLTDALTEKMDPASCNQACMKMALEKYAGEGRWRGWMVNNENTARFGSVIRSGDQKAIQALHLLLPGTAVIYYGDEIAMTNGVVPSARKEDPLIQLNKPGRDEFRTPMLWTSGVNAGFCKANVDPWLPINADYTGSSVEYNNAHKVGYTMLKSFKALSELRAKESFQFGAFSVDVLNDDILYFKREAKGFANYLVTFNRNAKTTGFANLADTMTLAYDSMGDSDVGKTYNTKEAPIGFNAGEVYVFSY